MTTATTVDGFGHRRGLMADRYSAKVSEIIQRHVETLPKPIQDRVNVEMRPRYTRNPRRR